ncbi:MFS transporter [Chloroflexi bacterium TSY]|nr:MFS transporter [Chloroflexi bacterium TSY]
MPTTNKRTVLWLATAAGFLSFFIFGFVDNLKGPTLPSLLADLSLSDGQGGAILLSAYLGFMFATVLTGFLADIAGNRAVLVIAGICLCVGLTIVSGISTFWLLMLAMFIMGLGMGSIEVGGNALIVELHSTQSGRYLNLLAAFHGIGALLVPLYVALLLENGFLWRHAFGLSLIITVTFTLYMLFLRIPNATNEPQVLLEQSGIDLNALRATGFTRQMILFYLLIAFYVSVELGLAAWLVKFLQQDKGFSIRLSTFFLSLFFGGLLVGRLIGSVFVEKVGYLRSITIVMVAAVGLLSIGIFGPDLLAFCIPLTGLCLSIVFPTITAAVSKRHAENTGTILGLLFTFGGLGGALGPWIIGVMSDQVGLEWAIGLPIAFSVVCLGILGMIVLSNQTTNTIT